jgi:hypothetical protein
MSDGNFLRALDNEIIENLSVLFQVMWMAINKNHKLLHRCVKLDIEAASRSIQNILDLDYSKDLLP